jgi:hypothetical protein
MDGFEIPLLAGGVIAPGDESAVLQALAEFASGRRARHVLTCVPATMGALSKDPFFGEQWATKEVKRKSLTIRFC